MKPLTIKNVTFGEGTPKICIPVTGNTEALIFKAAETIASLPHQVVEWRADYFEGVTDHSRVLSVLEELHRLLPGSLLLFTFRTKKEGGVTELSDREYLDICRNAAESGLADLLDLELFTGWDRTGLSEADSKPAGNADGPGLSASPLLPLLKLARGNNVHVILSSHDFQKTPPKEVLVERLSLMERLGCDIAKLAVMPQNADDVLTLLAATRQASVSLNCPVITMSMGPLGVVSRISGRLTGSCLTFGTAGEASAPGQLPAETLKFIMEQL